MTDYTVFHYDKKEFVKNALIGAALSAGILYLFYAQMLVSLIGAVIGSAAYLRYRRFVLAKKTQWELMAEFKDAMDAMVSALVAGYSMENAVTEAYHDLMLLYGHETPMIRELKDMKQKLNLHRPLDGLLLELGRRSGVEDIVTFAQIYATARKSGGNLVKVMKRTAENIGGKQEIQREIETMAAGKKMESSCMTLIPLLIIVYLQVCSPGFLDPLYEGLTGRVFMTVMLVVYALAVLWSRRIMQIEC